MDLYSIVVPVYNSEHTLPKLHDRVRRVFDETLGFAFELILVDDHSRDRSWQVMKQLHDEDPRVKIIQLARNFGQPSATLCGFSYARGNYVITMDDDLQHQPEELPKMIRYLLEHDDTDVVLATYVGRKHGPVRRLGTAVSRWATSRMMGSPPDLDLTSFRLMRSFVKDAVLTERIYHPQIGNLILSVSDRVVNVPVQHAERDYGRSGYTFRRLARDLLYDITSHSAFPMTAVRNIGLAGIVISIILAIHYLIQYLVWGSPVMGWTTLVLLVLMGFSLVLLSLGVMGMYLINTLYQSKKVPSFVVRRAETGDREQEPESETQSGETL